MRYHLLVVALFIVWIGITSEPREEKAPAIEQWHPRYPHMVDTA